MREIPQETFRLPGMKAFPAFACLPGSAYLGSLRFLCQRAQEVQGIKVLPSHARRRTSPCNLGKKGCLLGKVNWPTAQVYTGMHKSNPSHLAHSTSI